ncbi:MAG: Hsp20/alpha crystallin family protein [Candidatus Delongbacteria bacterium]|nr:Hsp20/alpha crystallin family protein [Candidatus Delongbacteria bacterium]
MSKKTEDSFRFLQEFNQPSDEGMQHGFAVNHQVVGSLHMSWKPPMDIFYSGENLVIIMDIAGVEESQLYLSFQDQRLEIRGIRPEPGGYPDREFHQLEVNFGPFQRSVSIPFSIESEQIRARYAGGFLEIVIPVPGVEDRRGLLELD